MLLRRMDVVRAVGALTHLEGQMTFHQSVGRPTSRTGLLAGLLLLMLLLTFASATPSFTQIRPDNAGAEKAHRVLTKKQQRPGSARSAAHQLLHRRPPATLRPNKRRARLRLCGAF